MQDRLIQSLVDLQAAIFRAPSIQRLLCDARMPANLDCRLAPADEHIHLTQLRYDLLRRKPLTSHTILQSLRPKGFSSEWDQFSKADQPYVNAPVEQSSIISHRRAREDRLLAADRTIPHPQRHAGLQT